jgi:hypothetical protein
VSITTVLRLLMPMYGAKQAQADIGRKACMQVCGTPCMPHQHACLGTGPTLYAVKCLVCTAAVL